MAAEHGAGHRSIAARQGRHPSLDQLVGAEQAQHQGEGRGRQQRREQRAGGGHALRQHRRKRLAVDLARQDAHREQHEGPVAAPSTAKI